MRSILWDKTGQSDMRKRLFYLCFERAPDFAGLTVAWLEAGEFAFDERSRDLDRPIEDFLDFPDVDHLSWSSQRVATIGAFFLPPPGWLCGAIGGFFRGNLPGDAQFLPKHG